ncbi:hypothetical protein ACRAWD_23175 [Caulobacter segnis]
MMIARAGLKTPSANTPIGALSGGNQQKVVIGRCPPRDPVALLLDEPARGIDIGARAEVFPPCAPWPPRAWPWCSPPPDMLEALSIADRILVMSKGRLTADLSAAGADEGLLVRAANGATISSSNGRSARAALAH